MSQPDVIKNLLLNLVLTLLFFVAGVIFPVAGVFLLPLALHPALAFGIRYGPRIGLALPLLSLLVLYVVGGAGLASGYWILVAIMVPLLFSFSRSMAVELRVMAGALGGLLGAFGMFWVSFGALRQLYEAMREILQANVTASLEFYAKIGFSEQDIEQLREHIPGMVNLVVGIMPALTFLGFVVVILFNLAILVHRFPEYRPRLLSKADLREWKSAEPVVWFFIASGFLYLLASGEALRMVAVNLFLVSLTFYFFQGLAIISYYFHYRKVPLFLRGLGYGLLALEQIMMLAVVGLGLFDLWIDFRGLNKKNLTPNQIS